MTPASVLRAAIPAMALAGLLAACGDDSPKGSPILGDTPGPGPGAAPSVPKVFTIDACTMPDEEVIKDIGYKVPGKGTFKPDRADEDQFGNQCMWNKGRPGPGLTVIISTGEPGAGRPEGGAAPEESTLDGRKTVRFADEPERGGIPECSTTIVVAPKVKVVVKADGSESVQELCAKVDKVLPSVSAKIPD